VRIYSDTSFLVSVLNDNEVNHASSLSFFLQHLQADWLISSWLQFEANNSVRQLVLQKVRSKEKAEASRRLLKNWNKRGLIQFEETDLSEAVIEAEQISAAEGTNLQMRSADVLHVALLEQINPDLFVTRDKAQHKLAVARAFKSQLLP
jgi:predicted nucleic acid-binding protein